MASKQGKSSIVAAALSIVLPGAGHAYLGKWRRGLLWLVGVVCFSLLQGLLSPVELDSWYNLVIISMVAYDAIITTYEINGKIIYRSGTSKVFRGVLIVYGTVGLASYIVGLYPSYIQEIYITVPAFYYPYWSVSGAVFLASVIATYRLKKIGAYALLTLIAIDTLANLYFSRFVIGIDAVTLDLSLVFELLILAVIYFVIRRRWVHFS